MKHQAPDTVCEECSSPSRRHCDQCGRYICSKCAKSHRMGIVQYADLPEEDQPPWCRRLTAAEEAALDRLPLTLREVQRDVHRRKVYWHLQRDRYVRWTDGGVLVRTR